MLLQTSYKNSTDIIYIYYILPDLVVVDVIEVVVVDVEQMTPAPKNKKIDDTNKNHNFNFNPYHFTLG